MLNVQLSTQSVQRQVGRSTLSTFRSIKRQLPERPPPPPHTTTKDLSKKKDSPVRPKNHLFQAVLSRAVLERLVLRGRTDGLGYDALSRSGSGHLGRSLRQVQRAHELSHRSVADSQRHGSRPLVLRFRFGDGRAETGRRGGRVNAKSIYRAVVGPANDAKPLAGGEVMRVGGGLGRGGVVEILDVFIFASGTSLF